MRRTAIVSLAILFGMVLSCSDDPAAPPKQAAPQFQNLSQKWHVLSNIELAWNEYNANRYEELLDENYTFVFAPGDVGRPDGSGGFIPDQWPRSVEVQRVQKMFLRSANDPHQILSIDLDLKFDPATLVWNETVLSNAPYAGETWYTATVPYAFTIKTIGDNTYITGGGQQASYTVRPVDVGGKTVWRLVVFRDLGSN